jgi:hypothetical protein
MLSTAPAKTDADPLGPDAHPVQGGARNVEAKYLVTDEAAAYLRRTVSWLLRQADIPYLPGRPNSYSVRDLDAWFERKKHNPFDQ